MITKKFKEEYAKLNPKQKEVVDAIEGPVMVVAGPGTGKTTILTLRIANILLKTDTPPSGILALTFTEAGAKAMRVKLRKIIGNRALEVPIHTFHGFAASVIAEFQDHFAHLSKSKQITDIETEQLLRNILNEKKFNKLRPIGDPDFYIAKIIGAISDAKQEAWTPEILKSFAQDEIERIKNSPDSISTRGKSKGGLKAEALTHIKKAERTILFADVYENYEKKKTEERKIDFDDLIFELLQALRKDELLLQSLQEKFLYILLDEHQDTNDAQNLIVKTIADFFETPNLFVVGDEKQAIYRFQGASIENFLNFQKTWDQMKIISLVDNYRSHQYILDTSFKMIEQNYKEGEHFDLRTKLKSGTKEVANPLDLVIAPNLETEEAYLVKNLQKILKESKDSSIAIIVRKNSEVAKIFSILEANDIPAKAERGANIFSHPVGALYFSLLDFFRDPGNIEALAQTLVSGLWDLDFAKQTRLIKLIKSGKMAEIEKEIPILFKIQKKLTDTAPLEFLYLVADLSGFTHMVICSPIGTEVWRGIISLAEDLTKTEKIEDPKILIEALLAYKKSAERRTIKINTGQALSQITIMTAHSSKGLEFDYVFLPYAVEESWIKKNHNSYFVLPKEKKMDDNIRDERRLFYVGLTRAKKHVSISFHNEDNLGKVMTPLRFIDELDQNFIKKIKLEKTNKVNIKRNLTKIEAKQNQEKIEYAKQVLLEKGLSVTALNHFMDCPNKFFYKSILKIPEAPNANSEKGNAMHEAMSNIWQSKNKKIKQIEKIIIDTVNEYFRYSLLPLLEKETVLEELVADAPIVALALVEHFKEAGKVSTESWVENYFSYQSSIKNSEKIEIKLHGKLDVIREQENKIFIYDYKTRKSLSLNAIKGETANGDDNYFRQLIFYKILLEESSKFKNKFIEPALIFIKPDSNGRCPIVSLPIENTDTERVKNEITNLIKNVWSGDFLTNICDDKDCQYCGYRKLLT